MLAGLQGLDAQTLRLLADCVLAVHALLAAWVVGGLVAIVAGHYRGWSWVNAYWLRLAHLAAIAIIAAEAWLGADCPLTSFEMWLRRRAGASTYSGGFVEHWLQRLLYYEAPAWVFIAAYSLFALLVALAWWRFPPASRHMRGRDET